MAVSFAFVCADVPTTVVVPLADAVSLLLVLADVPTTVVVPDAAEVSAAFVVADVPVTLLPTAPLALDVSLALVFADVPVTVVVPLADEVSLALVLAEDPMTVVVPLADEVSAALVVADVPLDPLLAAKTGTHMRCGSKICHGFAATSLNTQSSGAMFQMNRYSIHGSAVQVFPPVESLAKYKPALLVPGAAALAFVAVLTPPE